MKIRIIKAGIVFVVLALILGAVNVLAVEEKPIPGQGTEAAELDRVDEDRLELSADAAFLSQYVWRGWGLSKDSFVIQPSVTASYKGFSLNLWGNMDTSFQGTEDSEKKFKWNETDLTFSYGHSFGMVGLEGGFIYYAVDGMDDWKEFYLSLGLDTILAPTVTVYREISKNQGWYVNLGISHSFELPHEITLDLGGYVSYWKSDNDNMMERNSDLSPTTKRFSGLHDGLLSVGLNIPFWKYFKVTPSIAYAFPLSHAADNEMQYNSLDEKANHVFGGVTFSMAF
ncbi:MAG: hypothetical protein H8E19_04155 [Deltaproteobacteria bacterium]|uniref:Uncharacterized protein n=1 Tax=Candidatus Desulfacyla euxinica TaxID=2841693 RepID=A0A8J6MXA0_9DELT|nr:hypothetical protein [Candidatus Desulfacyla euxinica]